MTVYEFIKTHRGTIEQMDRILTSLEDCTSVDLYEDYMKMKTMRYKMTYIAQHLADKYGISERKVFRIVKRLSENVTL